MGTTTAVRLDGGRIYTGIVTASNGPGQLFSVREEETGAVVTARWAGSVFAGLVGLRAAYVPPVGSSVIFVYIRGKGEAFGMTPSGAPPVAGAGTKSILGDPEAIKNSKIYQQDPDSVPNSAHNPPADILEGELDLTNMMNVGVALLTGLAKLQAGDLAKVEVCLLNDMVRVVSHTFKHFNALGACEIYNDGRLNLRWTGTSYDHEAFGKKKLQEEKSEANEGEVELGDLDKIEDTFRARFSSFVGFLGDFINVYVTDPGQALGDIAQDRRSGKFRCHVGNDGTLLVQSVSEIAFERVVRIPVPIEKKRYDAPDGNSSKDFDSADLTPLKKWKFDPNPGNMWHAAFQLRHYARWLSSVYSLARYRQLTKDWAVPTEAATPAPKGNNDEEDREQANPEEQDFYETYATIRIMRDGSIVNMDGYGSATVMAGGNVHVSSAKHLTLEAAGDLNLVAGQDVNIKARRSVEITAVRGGIRCKARTWLHNFCEWGSIWNRSGAKDPRRESAPPEKTDAEQDPDPIILSQAIVNQATEGGISLEAVNTLSFVVRKKDVDAASVVIFSEGNIQASAMAELELAARGNVKIKAADILVAAKNMYHQIISNFLIGRGFLVKSGGRVINAQRISGVTISAPNILGRERKAGAPVHENHIGKIPTGHEEAYTGQLAEENPAEDYSQEVLPIRPPEKSNGTTAPAMGRDYTPELVETVTQQRLRLDADEAYASWNWQDDTLDDPEVNRSQAAAWPGAMEELKFNGGQPLHVPSSSATFENKAPAPQRTRKVFRFLKR